MRMQTMNGSELPRIGQGTWFLGEHPERAQEEMAALQAGVEAGMTLIDTAEMYGNGASEILIGKAIRHMDRVSGQQGLSQQCGRCTAGAQLRGFPSSAGHGRDRPVLAALAGKHPLCADD